MLPGFRRGSVFYLAPFSLEEGPERGNSPRPSDKEVVDFLASWRVRCWTGARNLLGNRRLQLCDQEMQRISRPLCARHGLLVWEFEQLEHSNCLTHLSDSDTLRPERNQENHLVVARTTYLISAKSKYYVSHFFSFLISLPWILKMSSGN